MLIHEMMVSVARFTGRTNIHVMIINMITHDELSVCRSWIDRNTGKVKEVVHDFRYELGELFTGKVSVDLGRDCILNLKNGQVESLENPNALSFGLS